MTIYVKDHISLKRYCEIRKVPYSPIRVRVSEKRMSPDEAIKDYEENKNRPVTMYKGVTLYRYCKERNLDYTYIYINWLKSKEKDSGDIDSFMNRFVDGGYYADRKGTGTKYFYKGKPFHEYCREKNLDYAQIMGAYQRWNFKNKVKIPCTLEYVIEEAYRREWFINKY